MTNQGRMVVAVVGLFGAMAAVLAGVLTGDATAVTVGSSWATLILGYAFGERNGEKRLASALNVLQAEQLTAAHAYTPGPLGVGRPGADPLCRTCGLPRSHHQ